jgi:hypothetical protein
MESWCCEKEKPVLRKGKTGAAKKKNRCCVLRKERRYCALRRSIRFSSPSCFFVTPAFAFFLSTQYRVCFFAAPAFSPLPFSQHAAPVLPLRSTGFSQHAGFALHPAI